MRSFIERLRQPKAITALIVVLNLSITLPLAAILSIWIDEAYSLNTTGKDISYTLQQALHFELQAPLYFILLNLWRSINNSIFFARLFSVICIVFVIFACNALAKRYLTKLHPAWFTFAIVFNPFTIWAALEIRPYALAILLSALLLIYFYDGYLDRSPQKNARIYYTLFSILALYTKYYLGFLLVANACALIGLKRWKHLRDYILWMVVVSLCFAPMLLVIPSQIAEHAVTIADKSSVFNSLILVGKSIVYYILPATSLAELRKWVTPVFVVVAVFLALKNRPSSTSKLIALGTIFVTLVACIILSLHKIGAYSMQLWHTVFIFIPLLLLVFSVLEPSLIKKSPQNWRLSSVLIFIVCFFYSTALLSNYSSLCKAGDWHRVATYIMANERANQPILTFTSEIALSLNHYYSGLNSVVPLPKSEDFKTYDVRKFVLNSEDEIWRAIDSAKTDGKSLWLVTDRSSSHACGHLGINYNCEILEKFVEKNYEAKLEKKFHGSSLKLLSRKPPRQQSFLNIES